jgi:ATP-dependent DNA ligase
MTDLAVIQKPDAMLCEKIVTMPDHDGSDIYEHKLDGGRGMAVIKNGRIKLFSRKGNDFSKAFPEIMQDLRGIPHNAVLDGEICVFEQGMDISRWENAHVGLYNKRKGVRNPYQVKKRMQRYPAVYVVFDILRLDGNDLTYNPLITRKADLRTAIPNLHHIKILPFHETPDMLLSQRESIEGIVIKRRDAVYEGKRSNAWRKYRFMKEGIVVAVDYEVTPKGIVCIDEKGHRFNINGHTSQDAKALIDEDGGVALEISYYKITENDGYLYPSVKRIRSAIQKEA